MLDFAPRERGACVVVVRVEQMGIDPGSELEVNLCFVVATMQREREAACDVRIGDWPQMAAEAGKMSLHFVNTTGAGILVAPFGGINRRLSANPIAAGVPIDGGRPMVLDISTCTLAEGKIRVAFNKGVPVPEGCIIDPQGEPTTDPKIFYGKPPGANHGMDTGADGQGTVSGQRLYQLIRQQGDVQEHEFTIEFLDTHVEAYSFTFG